MRVDSANLVAWYAQSAHKEGPGYASAIEKLELKAFRQYQIGTDQTISKPPSTHIQS